MDLTALETDHATLYEDIVRILSRPGQIQTTEYVSEDVIEDLHDRLSQLVGNAVYHNLWNDIDDEIYDLWWSKRVPTAQGVYPGVL